MLVSLTLPASGHASVRGPAACLADAGHVLAAAVWIGGLAFTGFGIAESRPGRSMAAARFLRRFSAIALAAVGLLGATAAVNAYSEIGSVEALWETHYGRLVILKTGLVVPLLALGYVVVAM